MKLFKNIYFYYVLFAALFASKMIGFNVITDMGTNFRTILANAGFIMILIGFPMFFEKKNQIRILALINIVLDFILAVDLFYFDYYKNFFSFFSLRHAGQLGEVADSLAYLFKPIYFVLALEVILNIIIIILISKIEFKEENFSDKAVRIFALLLCGIFMLNSTFYLARKKDKWVLTAMYDKKFIVQNTGILGYHYFDFRKFSNENNFMKTLNVAQAKELNNLLQEKNNNKPAFYGKYEGKNLIIVQIEAFQHFLIDKKINGIEVTPNINRLKNEEIYLSNFYHEISNGGTSDAEFAANTGLLPLPSGAVYYLYPFNKYESIANKLKEKGYLTSAMHGNDAGFWNRATVYKTLGFDKFESIDKFNADEMVGIGLSDQSFFRQAVEKMKNYEKPFYSFLISISSHYPFNDKKFKDFDVGNLDGTLLGNYLQSAHYTDKAIGEFVDELKRTGLWDNSVVIFYGDHYAIPYGNKEQLEKAIGEKINDDIDWTNNQRVVSIMHIPDFEVKGEVSTVSGQADIAPTVADLFGFSLSKYVGEDIFNKSKEYVIFPDGSFIYRDKIYLQSQNKMFDMNTKSESNDYDIINYIKKLYDYSAMIIRNNL
ncbi:LTA synthase family protein [Caloramator mitchellensis]|uniref:LTA synthase family protein n=1 Tax=Caloramator mitchellensis TaxID=908809 RepID=UPI0007174951|nr:LTA synthase family protein [Caloramator mitchellensis]